MRGRAKLGSNSRYYSKIQYGVFLIKIKLESKSLSLVFGLERYIDEIYPRLQKVFDRAVYSETLLEHRTLLNP